MKNVYKTNLHKHFLNTDNRRAVIGFPMLTNCVYEYLDLLSIFRQSLFAI